MQFEAGSNIHILASTGKSISTAPVTAIAGGLKFQIYLDSLSGAAAQLAIGG
jgi:hypothetical protein